MTYKIEKNIPIAETVGKLGKTKYPWPDMEIGDSVLFKCNNSGTRAYSRYYYAARRWAIVNNKDWEFRARKVEGGVRVWRVK